MEQSNPYNYEGRGRARGQYILEGHTPVPCDDLMKWGEWTENAHRTGEFIVKSDMVTDVFVSTVFLGLDHGYPWLPGSRPLLFETMIFRGPLDMYQRRYSTWVGAEYGHAQALKKCIRVMKREGRRKMAMATCKLWTYVNAEGAFAGNISPKSNVRRIYFSTI
jgi:hypothetical protein